MTNSKLHVKYIIYRFIFHCKYFAFFCYLNAMWFYYIMSFGQIKFPVDWERQHFNKTINRTRVRVCNVPLSAHNVKKCEREYFVCKLAHIFAYYVLCENRNIFVLYVHNMFLLFNFLLHYLHESSYYLIDINWLIEIYH